MTKPTTPTNWATSASALKTATDADRWENGWKTLPNNQPDETGERPNLNQQNYWQNAVHQWVVYFDQQIDIFLASTALPLGAIVPLASHIAGSFQPPASGVVVEGFMVCDGAAIPGGVALSGFTPNLSDERFIMGSAAAGSTGGVNTMNLQHSHTVNAHSHTVNSHSHSGPNHSHSIGSHSHSSGSLYAVMAWKSAGILHWERSPFISGGVTTDRRIGGLGSDTVADRIFEGVDVLGSTGSASISTGNAGTGSTGNSAPGTNNSSPGTNNQLSSTQDNRPLYLSVTYLIRVN